MVPCAGRAGAISTIQMGLQEIPNPQVDQEMSSDSESQSATKVSLTEDQALALLGRRDLSTEEIEKIFANAAAMKSRKVQFALAGHPRTPRRLSLRLVRQFYTFDLMHFALSPSVATDLKRFADELLIARLQSVTLGERLSLARRGSTAVAAALLLDKEIRVAQTALENGRLTETSVAKALSRVETSSVFVEMVCRHSKWSPRREIRLALLRNRHTPVARAIEFARAVPPPLLRDTLHASRLPEKIKEKLRQELSAKK